MCEQCQGPLKTSGEHSLSSNVDRIANATVAGNERADLFLDSWQRQRQHKIACCARVGEPCAGAARRGQHRQPATCWQAADAEECRQVEQVVDVVPTQNAEALKQGLILRIVASVATCESASGPACSF